MRPSRPITFALAIIIATWALGEGSLTHAAKLPLSHKGLLSESDVVVVAAVTRIEIQKERARFDPGFGNYDWAIYLTLDVQKVEKGARFASDEEMVVRCFLIKTRRSMYEYATRGGHDPIPEVGQKVRAYVQRDGDDYVVIDPNGFASVDGTPLVQAKAIRQLRRGGFTFFLSLEVLILGLLIAAIVMTTRRWIARRNSARLAAIALLPPEM